MTLEDRLTKLEGIVEATLKLLPDRVAALEAEVRGLRQEMRAEVQGLRQEVKAEVEGLRQEMRAEVQGLRQEIQAALQELGQEQRAEIQALRQEMHTLVNTAFNRLMLLFTGVAVILALLTLLR